VSSSVPSRCPLPCPLAGVATPAGTVVLTIPQPLLDDNSGWIASGPKDKLLYTGIGGGSERDANNTLQNMDLPLGAILRIDLY
jgi:hypothetical protein